jgi:hypothetical protein
VPTTQAFWSGTRATTFGTYFLFCCAETTAVPTTTTTKREYFILYVEGLDIVKLHFAAVRCLLNGCQCKCVQVQPRRVKLLYRYRLVWPCTRETMNPSDLYGASRHKLLTGTPVRSLPIAASVAACNGAHSNRFVYRVLA